MIDLIIQNPNQNLLYRPNRETYIVKNNTDVTGFYEKAVFTQSEDTLYRFPLEEARIVRYFKNNPLSMYDEQAYKILASVVETIKESCKKYDLSYKKNKYFLYSEIVEDQNPEFWYDAGGASKPNLFGYVSPVSTIKTQYSQKWIPLV